MSNVVRTAAAMLTLLALSLVAPQYIYADADGGSESRPVLAQPERR